VSPLRRALMLSALAGSGSARAQDDESVRRGRALTFPRDHGPHLRARTEWWYATGWLGTEATPTVGFQVTFFRSRTGLAQDNPSRFAARHLLFAHAALSKVGTGSADGHWHDQRAVRWSGQAGAALGHAALGDGDVRIGTWSLRHDGQRWIVRVPSTAFTLDLALQRTQPLLLQGEAGFSRKGPDESQASHYLSEPQLTAVAGDGARGRAWLDHEWSDQILHPQAVGWDWIGMNLFDGSALTAFVLRRRDGSALWAGGSFRAAGAAALNFTPQQVRFSPGRRWLSPGSGASYPVQWQIQTPAGLFSVRALRDAQELDSRASTGSIYWEGLSELLDERGLRVGLGYLEMTGYAAPLRMG
jgi:predicted secreted hydrolase